MKVTLETLFCLFMFRIKRVKDIPFFWCQPYPSAHKPRAHIATNPQALCKLSMSRGAFGRLIQAPALCTV